VKARPGEPDRHPEASLARWRVPVLFEVFEVLCRTPRGMKPDRAGFLFMGYAPPARHSDLPFPRFFRRWNSDRYPGVRTKARLQ
jgi:hypothetical protein